jgi:hypothetical protein
MSESNMQGIPAQYRSWAWPEISGAGLRRAEQMGNYYEAMVHMGEASSDFSHQIELVRTPVLTPNVTHITAETPLDHKLWIWLDLVELLVSRESWVNCVS